jgi:hypothetical protein
MMKDVSGALIEYFSFVVKERAMIVWRGAARVTLIS